MSDTVVSLLTPPGTGAIATVEVRGPRAWELARKLFTPAGKPLPESPETNRFWFGSLGNDEVVLAACGVVVEVHCHGGRRVVQWVLDQFLANGCVEERNPRPKDEGFELLQRAPTFRTAGIILDQLNGAFASEVRRILTLLETDPREAALTLHRLAELGNTVGRHLVEPWKVVVAGPPNVGKSSLINALVGYQRSVVSEVAGTTRDAVSVQVAFDGWPVELLDTAGMRDAEGLEAEGIEHALCVLRAAELVIWVLDASSRDVIFPDEKTEAAVHLPRSTGWVLVMNKADRSLDWPPNYIPGAIHLSATTGENVPQLADWIVHRLVRNPPSPGAAVPFTTQLIEQVNSARQSALQSEWEVSKQTLLAALCSAACGFASE